MKKLTLIACMLLTSIRLIAQTSSVTLAWSPSPDQTVIGYHIYQGGFSMVFTNIIVVGLVTNTTVPGLTKGSTYFFAATCFNTNGLESPLSNQVSYTVPLSPPVITVGPVGVTNNTGAGVTFNVTAIGQSLTYQWMKNGLNISGATNSSFALPSITWVDNGLYSVNVGNSSGTVNSGAVKLAVIPAAVTGLTVGP